MFDTYKNYNLREFQPPYLKYTLLSGTGGAI